VIIRGFKVPLKQANTSFFKNILIPLHKVQTAHLYFVNLVKCCKLFIIKENKLINNLLEGLLRFWPYANSIKEELFIDGIDEVLKLVNPEDVDQCIFLKLCKRILKSVNESQFMTGMKSICLINNNSFLKLLQLHKDQILRHFFPALDKLFDDDLDEKCFDVLNEVEHKLSSLDQNIYEETLKNKSNSTKIEEIKRNKIEEKWNTYSKIAQERDNSFTPPRIPYHENVILSEFNPIYRKIGEKERFLHC